MSSEAVKDKEEESEEVVGASLPVRVEEKKNERTREQTKISTSAEKGERNN